MDLLSRYLEWRFLVYWLILFREQYDYLRKCRDKNHPIVGLNNYSLNLHSELSNQNNVSPNKNEANQRKNSNSINMMVELQPHKKEESNLNN